MQRRAAIVVLLVAGGLVGPGARALAQPGPSPLTPPPGPVDLPAVGPVTLDPAPAVVIGNNLTFLIGDEPVGLGLDRAERGACSYDGAMVMLKVGTPSNDAFADGYWATSASSADALYGCLDLRDGFLLVLVSPPARRAAVAGALAELRRAAYARHGAPLATGAGPIVLPHTGQRVEHGGPGRWKVVDGEKYARAGGNVFVSLDGLGGDSTSFHVAVVEEPCRPGAASLDASTSSALFPRELGPTWLDTEPYKLRWSAWACLAQGGGSATIAVQAPLAHDGAPELRDVALLRPVIEALVRSYGVELQAPRFDPGPSRPSAGPGAAIDGLAGFYLGVLSLMPPADGDRRLGFLVGFDARVFGGRGAVRPGLVFDVEAGYGGGELIGELRGGFGVRVGPFEAVLGVSAGSTGPAAAADAFAQLGLALRADRRRIWLGASRAIGLDGPDHDRLEARVVMPGRDETGLYLGARYLRFGDDPVTSAPTGSAILVTVGGGAATVD